MAKNKNKQQTTPGPKPTQAPQVKKEMPPRVETFAELLPEDHSWTSRITRGYIPYIIIAVLGIAIYCNTFNAQFALDDDIVICKNEYVLQGVQGIPDIFSKDLFDSFYKQMNTTAQLAGGRYRPLSVATFAIEQEFIGTRENANFEKNIWDTNKNGKEDVSEDVNGDGVYNDKDYRCKGFGMRHINNVLIYILAVSMLFVFLSTVVFKQNKLQALIISLLFLAHPIHTEVVANVKSRDEIMSLLFMLLTLILAHKYEAEKSVKLLLFICLSFICALLSKEYGATLIILIPLSLYLFGSKKFETKNVLPLMIGLLLTFFIYYGIRSGIVIGASNLQDKELMNNPYLLANDTQKLATKLFIFLKYFATIVFPHPLSSDYGYNSIPYKDFSDIRVWLSILLLMGMVAGGLIAFKRKNWMAFAIGFYLLTILLVTNLIFNVGATMGERLVFHASLGYCMLLGFALVWVANKLNNKNLAMYLAIPVLLLYSVKTFSRNYAWHNDISLALTDVKTMPESISLNGNAASRNIDLSELPKNKTREMEFVRKSIDYGTKAVTLHPGFVNGFLNLGIAYAKLEKLDSAKICWDKAFSMYPSHPSKNLYYNLLADSYYRKGFNLGGQQKWAEGKALLQQAVNMSPGNARYWYDLGGFAYNSQDYAKAKEAWAKAYQLNPSDTAYQKVQALLK
jgi:tetratricopeptide (TPR) repeat protein